LRRIGLENALFPAKAPRLPRRRSDTLHRSGGLLLGGGSENCSWSPAGQCATIGVLNEGASTAESAAAALQAAAAVWLKGCIAMFYRALLVCLATLGSVAHHRGHAEESKEKGSKEPGVLLSSKVATDGGFLTLPVIVGDQWRLFMVDTGTTVTTLDTPLVKDLPKADEAMRAMRAKRNGASIPDLFVPPKMVVSGTIAGEIEVPGECAVASLDLSEVRAASKQYIEGILGFDFLVRYAMEIDLAAGTLRLLDSRRLPVAKHDAILDIDMRYDRPYLPVATGDVKSLALLDTGALSTLHLDHKLYRHLVDHGKLEGWLLEAKEVNGKKKGLYMPAGWLYDLKVGPFTHYYQAVKDNDDISLLGLYYWRRYHCIFDFPKKLVYLDKGPFFNVFDDSHHAGIHINTSADDKKKKVVTAVNIGGWAEDKVRVGDQLFQIDGEGVESDSAATIYRRMSFHHDRTCELRLIRDGKEFTVVLPATGLQPKLGDDGELMDQD
jgi:hypothetical protein